MNTDQLMDMLARNAGPAPHGVVVRKLAPIVLLGLLCSGALAWWLMGLLPAEELLAPATWIKLAYAAALATAAGLLTGRLARPLAHVSAPWWMVLGAMAAMLLVGAVALGLTPAEERLGAVLGQSWLQCPWTLMAFSLPSLAGILWAVRGLAPTKPRQAGWACGLLAGALGAMGYALACPEPSSAFVATWYTLGVLMTAGIGRWIGPRVLRW